MIIYGTRSTLLAEEELPQVTCSNCGETHPHLTSVISSHVHIFWIPLFPYSRKGVSMCRGCGASWTRKEMSPTLQEHLRIVRERARFKPWQFAGVGVIAILIGWGNYTGRQREAEERAHLAAPQAGDVYAVKENDGNYSTLKVVDVAGQEVYLLENTMAVNKRAGTGRIDRDENYGEDTLVVSIEALQALHAEDVLYDVTRLK